MASNMNLELPIRSTTTSRRNQDSRNYFTNYTPPSSTEAINGPVRELNTINDRLIVGVDFGTTFSGYVGDFSKLFLAVCKGLRWGLYE